MTSYYKAKKLLWTKKNCSGPTRELFWDSCSGPKKNCSGPKRELLWDSCSGPKKAVLGQKICHGELFWAKKVTQAWDPLWAGGVLGSIGSRGGQGWGVGAGVGTLA